MLLPASPCEGLCCFTPRVCAAEPDVSPSPQRWLIFSTMCSALLLASLVAHSIAQGLLSLSLSFRAAKKDAATRMACARCSSMVCALSDGLCWQGRAHTLPLTHTQPTCEPLWEDIRT